MTPFLGNFAGSTTGECYQGGIAVHMHLAPYLEAGPMFAAFNFSNSRVRASGPTCLANSTLVQIRSSVFICPSEARDPGVANTPINNYRYNIGATICRARPGPIAGPPRPPGRRTAWPRSTVLAAVCLKKKGWSRSPMSWTARRTPRPGASGSWVMPKPEPCPGRRPPSLRPAQPEFDDRSVHRQLRRDTLDHHQP